MLFIQETKKDNNIKTFLIGEFKEQLITPLELRNKSEFIKACKRVNVNPYPLMDFVLQDDENNVNWRKIKRKIKL